MIKIYGMIVVAVVGVAVAALVFVFPDRAGEPVESLGGGIVLAHDKGNLPSFQYIFEQHGRKAGEETGIGFVPMPSQTTDLFINRMKAVLPTENAPEMFTWWSARRVSDLVEEGLVNDLTHLWDKHGQHYSSEIREAYTIDGRVYGFPYSVEYWPVWYNKQIFSRLGIREPETWDEFIAACETLKAASVDPILHSLQLDWYTVIWFAQLIIGEDPDFYRRLCEGRASYADPVVRDALGVYAEMLRNGYFSPPSVNMFTNAGHMWNNERFGMVLAGTWYYSTVLIGQNVDPETIGVFILPPRNPAAEKHIMMESGPVFTARHAPNAGKAEIVADWWMGPEGSSHFSRRFGSYSANSSVDVSHLTPKRQRLLSLIRENSLGVVNRYWEAAPIPVVEAAMAAMPLFMVDPDTKEDVIAKLTAVSDAYWSENR